MRQGCYELLVLGSDNSLFEECELDGKCFIRAEPGHEYKVKFIIHRDASGAYPFPHAICVLAVDGTEVDRGVYFHLDSSPESAFTYFKGFRIDSATIQAFEFTELKVDVDHTSPNEASKTGLLQVAVYEAQPLQRAANSTYISPTIAPADRSIKENKKFWQQSSLATARGREVSQPFSPVGSRRMRAVPDAIVEVQCHTAGVLDFLQEQHKKMHTRSEHPEHIDLTTEPDPVLTVEPTPVLPPVVVDLRQENNDITAGEAKVKVKLEKKRKLRSGGRTVPKNNIVDLMQQEEQVEVKLEHTGTKKSKNQKKRAGVAGARGKGTSLKKARAADGANNEQVEMMYVHGSGRKQN